MFRWRSRQRDLSSTQRLMLLDQWAREAGRWLGRVNKRKVQCYKCRAWVQKNGARMFGVEGLGRFGFLCGPCRATCSPRVVRIRD